MMLAESALPKKFWAEAINTVCHILNKSMVRPILNKTPYELLRGKKPNVSYFKPFRVKYFVHNNNKENLDKFDSKSELGYFLRYSDNSRSYRVFHVKNNCVEESSHVLFSLMLIDLMIRILMKSFRRPSLLKNIKKKNNIFKDPHLKLHSLMILQAQET